MEERVTKNDIIAALKAAIFAYDSLASVDVESVTGGYMVNFCKNLVAERKEDLKLLEQKYNAQQDQCVVEIKNILTNQIQMTLEIFEKGLRSTITSLPSSQVVDMIKAEFPAIEIKDKLPMKLIDNLMKMRVYDRSYDSVNEDGDDFIGVWLGGECIKEIGTIDEFFYFIMATQDLSEHESDDKEYNPETGLNETLLNEYWIEAYYSEKYYKKFAVRQSKN